MLRIGPFRSLLVSIDDGFPGEDGGRCSVGRRGGWWTDRYF